MDSALHLLGIARKAGRAEVGEEPAGAACNLSAYLFIVIPCERGDTHFVTQ